MSNAKEQLNLLNKAIAMHAKTIECMQVLQEAMLADRERILNEIETIYGIDAATAMNEIANQSEEDVE